MPLMIEFLIVTFCARIRNSQFTICLSITTLSVWIVQGPVYGVRVVPVGTPVVALLGKLRPSTIVEPAGLVEGAAVGAGWDEVAFPNLGDPQAYALEISGDSMQPLYRDGDIVIVSPGASVRRGDRVVVKTLEGEVLAKELKRRTEKTIELRSHNAEHPDRVLPMDKVAWVARIMWSSQ